MKEKEQNRLVTYVYYIKEQKKENINLLYSESANSFVGLFVTWLVLGIGAYLVVDHQLAGIFLAMLVMTSLTVFEDVGPMAAFPIYLQDNKYAATRLFSVVQKEDGNSVDDVLEEPMNQLSSTTAPA